MQRFILNVRQQSVLYARRLSAGNRSLPEFKSGELHGFDLTKKSLSTTQATCRKASDSETTELRKLAKVGLAGFLCSGFVLYSTFDERVLLSFAEVAPIGILGLAYLNKSKPGLFGVLGLGSLIVSVSVGIVESTAPTKVEPAKEDRSSPEKLLFNIPMSKALYLFPIMFAPIAHILVSLGGSTGSFSKAKPFLAAAFAVTIGAIGQRLYLMEDAGVDSGRGILSKK